MLPVRYLILFLLVSCESSFTQSYKAYQNSQESTVKLEFLEKELEKNPNNEQALFYLGELLMNEGSYTQARSSFEKSLSISNKYANDINYSLDKFYRLELNKGIEKLKTSSSESALFHFINANQLLPDKVLTSKLISTSYYELNDYPNSVTHAKSCLRMDAKEYECGLILVNSLFALADYENSIKEADEFISFSTKKYEFLKLSIQSSLKLNDVIAAEKKFVEYYRGTRDVNALKQFGLALYNLHMIEMSELYLSLYHRQFRNDTDILRALSNVYLELNDYVSMVQINEQLVEKNPGDLELQKRLMLSYELVGDKEKYHKWKKQIGN